MSQKIKRVEEWKEKNIKKWSKSGFLYSLSEKDKKYLAPVFELMELTLEDYVNKTTKTSIISLASVRRCFSEFNYKIKNVKLVIEYVDQRLQDAGIDEGFFSGINEIIKMAKNKFNKNINYNDSIDWEAEFCKMLSEEIFKLKL